VLRLSIIVPLLGDLKRLEDTLVSVLENRPNQTQIVVVLNRPYDDPYDLHDEVDFVEAPTGAGLVDCFDWGVSAAEASIVHLLAPGIEATAGWAEAALEHFDADEVAAVAPLLIDRNDPSRILSAGLSYTAAGAIERLAIAQRLDAGLADSSRLLGPELLAGFYRRDILKSVCTMGERRCHLVAAADLALSLRHAGYRAVAETNSQLLACWQDFDSSGAWQEGLAAERLFRRWSALPIGIGPDGIVHGGRRSWFKHAMLVGRECLRIPARPSTLARAAGRLCACIGLGATAGQRFGSQSVFVETSSSASGPHFNDHRKLLRARAAG